jgi:hypothetical protein
VIIAHGSKNCMYGKFLTEIVKIFSLFRQKKGGRQNITNPSSIETKHFFAKRKKTSNGSTTVFPKRKYESTFSCYFYKAA